MKKSLSLCALGAALLTAFAPATTALAAPVAKVGGAVAHHAGKVLNKLADDYYLEGAHFDPIGAGENGDSRFNDELGMSIAPATIARHGAQLRRFEQRLRAIDRELLDRGHQTSYDILAFNLHSELDQLRFPSHLMPITQMDSVPVVLANYASGDAGQPLTTPRQYRDYLKRLNQLGPWLDQAVVNMREGMRTGVVLPRALVVSSAPQLRKLVSATPEQSTFYQPITHLPASFSAHEQALLKHDYRAMLARLNPALERAATFMENDYMAAARSTAGMGVLPHGAEWYQARVAAQTTTALTPEQIHATGLSEVARIQAQFAILGPKMGYTGAPSGLPTWVSAQPKYKPFKTEQEVLDVFRKLDATLRTKLPALFTLMPKAPLDLRLEPELSRATASDHYTAPAADGSRPGVFWSVVNDPKQYGSTGMVTLFLHEGQPGHHFHVALLQELGLPDFRKFGGNNAYTEGWALYAETLGKEMGLFDKPEDYFGHLNDELLRAARLVVDTGIHAKGWTREQAIAYYRETLGYSEDLARSEIERYMAWPAQALGYKIGALKIAELRARAQAALGDKFSLPAFHQIVLEDGTLPLALLEAKVERWIAKNR